MKKEPFSLAERVAIGIPLALFISLLLWWAIVPLPLYAIFAILLLFLLLQPMEQYFGEGARVAFAWVMAFLRAAVAVVTFAIILFLTSQVTHVYPADVYEAWWRWDRYGHDMIIWGRQAPVVVVREIIILVTLGGMVWGWSRGKKWAKRTLGFLWLIFIVWAIFPHWGSTWPARADAVDSSLANRAPSSSFAAVTSGEGSVAQAVAMPAAATSQICGEGAQDFSTMKTDDVKITLHDGCYRGPIALPQKWDGYHIFRSHDVGDWAQVWCDGRTKPQPKHSGPGDVGDDFQACLAPSDATTTFFARGRGTLLFRVANWR